VVVLWVLRKALGLKWLGSLLTPEVTGVERVVECNGSTAAIAGSSDVSRHFLMLLT